MTELQLEFIRKFGRKEFSFGCWLFIQNPDGYAQFIEETNVGNGFTIFTATTGYSVLDEKKDSLKDYEILGHPVQWHDVFARLKEKMHYIDFIHLDDDTHEICFAWTGSTDDLAIKCNPCESPMEQPEIIKQLLLLIK